MQSGKIYVSELSTSTHSFHGYHFCRGNSNRRKTRIGIVQSGHGAYIYMNRKLPVEAGDLVFIPENIYCYSEWWGDPEIQVTYVSCFMHYDQFQYEPQIIPCDETAKKTLLRISKLLSEGFVMELEAYSLFYRLLQILLPLMKESELSFDKTLQTAIAFIMENWDSNFSVAELAKECCVSESTVYHLFKKERGQTPIGFLNSIRINKAIEYLENTTYSVAAISQLVGFHSENHFRKIFTKTTGITPLKYRKK